MTGGDEQPAEPSALARRLVTIPRTYIAAVVVTLLLPVLLVVAAAIDAVRWLVNRTPWMFVRLVPFVWTYLVLESALLLVALGSWLVTAGGRLVSNRRYETIHFALQGFALATLYRVAVRLLDLRFEVEGEEAITPGPILLLIRHASIVDVLLPGVLVANPHKIRLRYVLKRELLQDPMFDVLGNRIPNHFVARRGADAASEIREVRRLAEGLARDEGVIIYPEGTRYTEAKHGRALERMSKGDPALYARAQKLRHVMPPRVGGPRALLEGAPGVDVVICAHDGLGGFAELGDLVGGELVGKRVRVAFWRVPAAEVPEGRREQMHWLFDQWARVDEWIERQREER